MAFHVSKALISIICAIGFIFQVIDVTQRYLQYQTKTLIQIEVSLKIKMPSLSVCFRSDGLLKRSLIEEMKGITVPIADANWTAYYEVLEKLSVKDLFHFVPQSDEILAKNTSACMIRFPGNFAVQYPFSDAEECYHMFDIRRFIQRQFMCYRFSVKLQTPRDHLLLSENNLTPNLPGTIYSILLDKTLFGDISLLTAFAHGVDTSELFDSVFTPSFAHHKGNDRDAGYVDLSISYRSLSIARLPPPYNTQCVNYHPFGSRLEKLLSKVRRGSIDSMKIVPTLDQIHEITDAIKEANRLKNDDDKFEYDDTLPFTTSYHVRNTSFAQRLRDLITKYDLIHPECEIKYFISNIKSNSGKSFKLTLNWPQDVDLIIEYDSVNNYIDYIIYISSCIGIWLGVSVLHALEHARNLVASVKKWREDKKEKRLFIKHDIGFDIAQRITELERQMKMITRR